MTINYVNFGFNSDDRDDEFYFTPGKPAAIQKPTTVDQTLKPNASGSSFVSMDVDNGLLPVRFEFSNHWRHYVSPSEVGRELLTAYRHAVNRHLSQFKQSDYDQSSLTYPHAHFIPHRQRLILLLEAETWTQYCKIRDGLFNLTDYTVTGYSIVDDEPVVIISGDKEAIRSIRVWPQWQGCTDPYAIEGEILACTAKIRASQLKFAIHGDWSQYSDEQLSELKDRHQYRLIESRS
ncbi:Uncharacterised protein [Nocardia otitidiscaviarum]|uniref:Uncharacterized protein n=1 Tax=Nocardia otitidiscaviarum TaxID=1823 RepID=A0A378YTJ2_9NOCA|nr:hypothetical protein [Nocardia otitidiscaviarum]SUA80444.1 Uncharacterised protein [Nocardia otitidiscaviarum]